MMASAGEAGADLAWRIQPSWRIRYPRGYRILRITRILQDLSRLRGTLAGRPGNSGAWAGGSGHHRRVGGEFVPGVRLAGEFYAEAVRPVLEAEFPRLAYAAALIGPGSEVLGFDPRGGVTVRDWLAAPWQRLAEVTAGAVFHDGTGGLTRARAALSWYPRDLWRYVLSCQWSRIAEEEAFGGRCAEAGDELGSAVVTARLGRDLMRLWLLMHRRYPPYSKWLGSAFARVPGGSGLGAVLAAAVAATGWPERERQLGLAYRIAAEAHNRLGLTEPLDPCTRSYYTRPYQVLDAGRFAAALSGAITDPLVGRLPPAGAADQVIDSTPALGDLRYPLAVTSVSDRDMPVLGVSDTQT